MDHLVGYFLFGLVVVLVVSWIALPFTVLGIKELLRELIDVTKEANRLKHERIEPHL